VLVEPTCVLAYVLPTVHNKRVEVIFGPSPHKGADREQAGPEIIYKSRQDLNDISFLSEPSKGCSLNLSKVHPVNVG
jgi:hypothetical protein